VKAPLKRVPGWVRVSLPWQDIGGLSEPSKMPCFSYSLPAAVCRTGSRLRRVVGSVCSVCYAYKGSYRRTSTINAMDRRLRKVQAMLSDSVAYETYKDSFCAVLDVLRARYFRWFDSGDLVDVTHLEAIVEIAARMPRVKFWLPTKEVHMVRQYIHMRRAFPSNLSVRVSSPCIDQLPTITTSNVNTSTVHEKTTPKGKVCRAYTRGGNCGNCRACWNVDVANVSYRLH
jgi:hypothetical protein